MPAIIQPPNLTPPTQASTYTPKANEFPINNNTGGLFAGFPSTAAFFVRVNNISCQPGVAALLTLLLLDTNGNSIPGGVVSGSVDLTQAGQAQLNTLLYGLAQTVSANVSVGI